MITLTRTPENINLRFTSDRLQQAADGTALQFQISTPLLNKSVRNTEHRLEAAVTWLWGCFFLFCFIFFWWRWCYLTLFPQRRSKRKKNLVYVVRRLMVTIEPITGSIESDCTLVDVRCREKPSVDFPLHDCDKDCLISNYPNFLFWKKLCVGFRPPNQDIHNFIYFLRE